MDGYLVLSRKLRERIFIGDDTVIEVVEIDRGKIRLGIRAPKDVPIYREEVLPPDHPLRGFRNDLDEARP